MVARYVVEPDSVVSMWPFYKFYAKVFYISHTNAYKKRLNDLIRKPHA